MDTTISRINQMLTSCSIPILLQDVKECIPSLWIALFESLFQTRLKGVKTGKEQETVAYNLGLLIIKLEKIGSVSLDYISVQKLMNKDTKTVQLVSDLFWELYLAFEDIKIHKEIQDAQDKIHPSRLEETKTPPLSDTSPIEFIAKENIDELFPESGIYVQEQDHFISSQLLAPATSPIERVSSIQHSPSPTKSFVSSFRFDSEQNSKIRVNRNDDPSEIKHWLTNVQDDIEFFEKQQKRKPVKKKQLRFQLSPIGEEKGRLETPLTTSLKIKRNAIIKKQQTKKFKATHLLDKILEIHKKVHQSPKTIWKTVPVKDVTLQDSLDYSDIEEYKSSIKPKVKNLNVEKSIPEKNLESFMDQIKTIVPIKEIPLYESERAWKSQIQTTKRALDSRLWNQKVQAQRVLKQIENTKPLDYIVKDITDNKKIQDKRKDLEKLKKAQRNINNRHWRIKQMQHINEKAKEISYRQQQKEFLKQQQLSRGLFDQYLNEQRRTIIEERKLERDIQLQLEKKQLLLQEQQQNELKIHIDLLQEEIQKLEQDEKLLQREQEKVFAFLQKEIRLLVKETQNTSKRRIQQIRNRLENDWNEQYRQDQARTIRPRFKVIKK